MFDRSGRKKLDARRTEALAAILSERQYFNVMVQRAQRTQTALDVAFVTDILGRFEAYEQRACESTNIDELDNLIDFAERQGQLRAYICPQQEIVTEGNLSIDLMEEWNVPKAVTAKLRDSLGPKLAHADKDVDAARSALRAVFEEYDSWASYTEEYEARMRVHTRKLFLATTILLALAILLFRWQQTFLVGLLLAGAAGSCASIMARMPGLDVSLSGDLDAYGRRIFNRVGVGIMASLIGCALLGWGLIPISIQGQTFAEVLSVCTAPSTAPCSGVKALILLGVPMLFGFSERALTSFEGRFFGGSKSGG